MMKLSTSYPVASSAATKPRDHILLNGICSITSGVLYQVVCTHTREHCRHRTHQSKVNKFDFEWLLLAVHDHFQVWGLMDSRWHRPQLCYGKTMVAPFLHISAQALVQELRQIWCLEKKKSFHFRVLQVSGSRHSSRFRMAVSSLSVSDYEDELQTPSWCFVGRWCLDVSVSDRSWWQHATAAAEWTDKQGRNVWLDFLWVIERSGSFKLAWLGEVNQAGVSSNMLKWWYISFNKT